MQQQHTMEMEEGIGGRCPTKEESGLEEDEKRE
jgi:hypothetical protein